MSTCTLKRRRLMPPRGRTTRMLLCRCTSPSNGKGKSLAVSNCICRAKAMTCGKVGGRRPSSLK
ncbi:hypothetical protein D3C85_1336020 [compost metagenome]